MFKACPTCGNVVDVDGSAVVETKLPGRPDAGICAAVQHDVMCRRCGGLVMRKLNGVEPKADAPDPRKKLPEVAKGSKGSASK